MSTEENKAVIRQLFDAIVAAWSTRNWAALDAFIASDLRYHLPRTTIHGRREYYNLLDAYRTGFADTTVTIEDQVAEGDKVVTRWRSDGVHQGEFLGVAPTGKHVNFSVLSMSRLQDGKVVEEWDRLDLLDSLQQLGASTLPAATAAAT